MATTPRGYYYPVVGTSYRPHLDIKALADSLDADIATLAGRTSGKPLCIVTDGTGQSIANGTDVIITMESETVDTHNFHSTSVNTSRVTPNIAGWYEVTVLFAVPTRSGGYTSLSAAIAKNGTAQRIERTDLAGIGSSRSIGTSMIIDANGSTDYFELIGQQTNAGSAAVTSSVAAPFVSFLQVEYIRPL